MTDGRIPGKWISEPRFAEMSADTWCVLTKALTWSNEAGTNGYVKRRYLSQFHPDGLYPNAYAELVELGLWAVVADGYQFIGWEKKAHQGGLGQSSAEQVQNQKDRSRRTSQAYREKQKDDAVTGHGDMSRRTGQDRTGTDTGAGSEVDETSGEVIDWPVAQIPVDPGYCDHGMTLGMKCSKCPEQVAEVRAA